MLVNTQTARTPSVDSLVKLWAELYTPDLSFLFPVQDHSVYETLVQVSSPEGRASTVAKLREHLVDNNCKLASIQARTLYEYIPTVLDLNEARRLAQFAFQVYIQLLELYQQPSSSTTSAIERLWKVAGDAPLSAWGIPDIEELAKAIEPVLLEFQEQHVVSKDWRTIGFITTLLNFSNKLLLDRLTPVEQALISPYFKFVEEQVSVPWQRVCAAAAKHELDSPALNLVQHMLPASSDISRTVYRRLTQMFPHHRSRRGGLDDPGVTHSCLRDLDMFQAYLWLCVLEESLTPIEQELVVLCVMVMERVEVKYEITAQWNQLLIDEILSRVNPKQESLLLPYIRGIQQLFSEKPMHLGAKPLNN